MWSDGCRRLKLRLRTGGDFSVERPGLHRLFYFLTFEASLGVEAMAAKFLKPRGKHVDWEA